jgi:ribosome-binding protein aMBF1 (putative translation factor)
MSKRDNTLSALGLNVRQRREARELTQEKLAEKAGLDATYISASSAACAIPASRTSPGSPRPWASPPPNSVRE